MKYDLVYDLAVELSIAMKRQPSMQAIDLIYEAAELKYPTRVNHPSFGLSRKRAVQHKLSNSDILESLRHYNRLRSKDAARYRSDKP